MLEKFKARCEYWLRFFGIEKEWVVYYSGQKLDRYAETAYWIDSKVATITLNTSEALSDEALDRVAFHEVAHLVLADVMALAKDRNYDKETADKEEHKLINRLEHVLLGKMKEWKLD